MGERVTAFAPGRVNLIGEHTDYTGGLVLPLALEQGITVSGVRRGSRLRLHSEQLGSGIDVALPLESVIGEGWGRYPTAVAAELGSSVGFEGVIESTLPEGGTGLSSSAALMVSVMLALGALEHDTIEERKRLAELARVVESKATGVLSGIMDQLISLTAIADHAMLIDCHTLELTPVPIPPSMEILAFHSGQARMLADSEYNQRRQACEEIERLIGPLRSASLDDVERIDDPVLRRRGRHVVGENARVRQMIEALAADDPASCGEILEAGHRSLSENYEVSTPVVDEIQARVSATPGVFGARMVGGGFGGSLVALCEPGTELDIPTWWLRARPGPGASLVVDA